MGVLLLGFVGVLVVVANLDPTRNVPPAEETAAPQPAAAPTPPPSAGASEEAPPVDPEQPAPEPAEEDR